MDYSHLLNLNNQRHISITFSFTTNKFPFTTKKNFQKFPFTTEKKLQFRCQETQDISNAEVAKNPKPNIHILKLN